MELNSDQRAFEGFGVRGQPGESGTGSWVSGAPREWLPLYISYSPDLLPEDYQSCVETTAYYLWWRAIVPGGDQAPCPDLRNNHRHSHATVRQEHCQSRPRPFSSIPNSHFLAFSGCFPASTEDHLPRVPVCDHRCIRNLLRIFGFVWGSSSVGSVSPKLKSSVFIPVTRLPNSLLNS